MKMERLEQMIQESLDAGVQEAGVPRNLLAGVMSRLGEQERPRNRLSLIPRTRLAWAVVSLAILLISGTAYAATSLMGSLFSTFAPDVEDSGLVVNLNLSQTIDGVTVSLEQGYADSNTVLIGYTVTGPKIRYYLNGGELSVVGGPVLPGKGGMGDVLPLGRNKSDTVKVSAFDASGIVGVPPQIELRFETLVADSPGAMVDQTGIGPFVFTFTLPFRIGKDIAVNQTVEAVGVPITLERLIISQAEAQAVFWFHGEYEDTRNGPWIVAFLRIPQGSPDEFRIVEPSSTFLRESYSSVHFPGDFTGYSGEWTLTITELVSGPERPADKPPGDFSGTAADVKRLAGPWIFRFDVP